MKQALHIPIFVFLMWSSVRAQEISKVLELMKVQESAWNEGNIEKFMVPYEKNDSLLFVGSKGVTRGWTNTLERYKKAYPDKASMGELSFRFVRSEQISADCIYVIGQWHLKKDKPASGHFTLLWRKKGGKWMIVSDHSS